MVVSTTIAIAAAPAILCGANGGGIAATFELCAVKKTDSPVAAASRESAGYILDTVPTCLVVMARHVQSCRGG